MSADTSSFWPTILVGYGAILLQALWVLKVPDNCKKNLFRYSGLEFIWRKFKPEDERTKPTGVVWAVGIYIALFGIASQRYENRVDVLEYKHTAFLTTVAAGAPFLGSKLKELEDAICPEQPDIMDPLSVLRSMFWSKNNYEEHENLLKNTIKEWRTELREAVIVDEDLSELQLVNANFNKAVMGYVNLSKAKLTVINLSEADLDHADLSEAEIIGGDLSKAYLRYAKLRKASLRFINLAEASLSYADLSDAKFSQVNLVKADLSGADLSNVFFYRVDLSKADLRRTNFIRAYLSETNLSKADLKQAKHLTFGQLSKAKSLWKTKGIREDILARLLDHPDLFKCPEY